MRLTHRGLTIELPEDDRRVAIIETVLFGGPLPAVLPIGDVAPPESPKAPTDPPPTASGASEPTRPQSAKKEEARAEKSSPPQLDGKWRAFWIALDPLGRLWMRRLARGWVYGVRAKKEIRTIGRPIRLNSLHLHIANRAREAGVPYPVTARGRMQQRRYILTDEAREALRPVLVTAKSGGDSSQ